MRKFLAARLPVVAVFCAICFLGGCNDIVVPDRNVFSTAAEQMRVTSPSGQLDAVLVRDPYGAAAGGGVDWNVYITTKGTPIRMKTADELFRADPLTGGQLVWHGSHLLEVHYDIAHIHQFRNLWGLHEVEDVGSTGERDWDVEIRLIPSSDFSVLNQDGSFRSQD
jgi:hypothetical protein